MRGVSELHPSCPNDNVGLGDTPGHLRPATRGARIRQAVISRLAHAIVDVT